jgi:hypothetical protein
MARGDDQDVPVPEADRLEQETPAGPAVAGDEPWPDPPLGSAPGDADADEADRLEQSQVVDGDPDEDYAPDQD